MELDKQKEAINGFEALGLESRLVTALGRLGYEEPTPIQQQAIPPLLKGHDLLGQAATGTGKTAAFALPLIQRLAALPRNSVLPRALILVPTRELAIQVSEAIHRYARELRITVVPIYGGQPYGQQIRAFERGIDIVVATPGRALDHLRRQTLRLDQVQTVVLDEADEMLDMGFIEDIETLLDATPAERQVMLFSATLPPRIGAIAKKYLRKAIEVKIAAEQLSPDSLPRVTQMAYIVHRNQKPEALGRVLDMEDPTSALIFCRTRNEVDELAEVLKGRGYQAETLHGGMAQAQRDRVIKRLRAGLINLVLATDVASRGLDIEQLTHVINYDVPSSPETYVHRIGRVGRAGREGIAITFAEPREHRFMRNIEQLTRQKIKIGKVPSVDDLRARRLEMTHAAVREAIQSNELDQFRIIVNQLAEEFDIVEVALGALKLAHQAIGGADSDNAQQEVTEVITPVSPFMSNPDSRPKASMAPSVAPKPQTKSKAKPMTAATHKKKPERPSAAAATVRTKKAPRK